MTEPQRIPYMTVDDYLQFEESATVHHEYVQGQVFAMTGSTQAHNAITINFAAALHGFLQGSGCRAYVNDMKLRVETANAFYYPDIMVTCEPFQAKSVFTCSPTLIIEVLSPSTRQIDRREKLVAYRQLSSLRQYILVHQNKCLVEVYTKKAEHQWEHVLLQRNDELRLEALPHKALVMPVSAVYTDIELPTRVEESEEEYELA